MHTSVQNTWFFFKIEINHPAIQGNFAEMKNSDFRMGFNVNLR